MEHPHQPFLKRAAQIDQHVAADDQIEPGKGRIARQVLAGENAQVAHLLVDPVAAIHPVEKSPQPLRRDILRDRCRIRPRPRKINRRFADVGRENLNRNRRVIRSQELHQRDGHRIRFLAGGTSRRPDANRTVPLRAFLTRRYQGGKYDLSECVEGFALAEKARHVNQKIRVKRLDLVGVLLNELQILLDAGDLVQHHPPLQSPADRRLLVMSEIDAGRIAQDGEDLREVIVVHIQIVSRPSHRDASQQRMAADAIQLVGDLLRRQHQVHGSGGHRRVVFGAVGLLHQSDSPHRLHLLESQRAIGRRARQDHSDGALLPILRQRAQKRVDGRVLRPVQRPRAQVKFSFMVDAHRRVGRHHVNTIGQDLHPLGHLQHRHGGCAAQKLRQRALVLGG